MYVVCVCGLNAKDAKAILLLICVMCVGVNSDDRFMYRYRSQKLTPPHTFRHRTSHAIIPLHQY